MITLLLLACSSGIVKIEDTGKVTEEIPVETGLVTTDDYMNTGQVLLYTEDADSCYVVVDAVYMDTSYSCEGSLWMKEADYTYDASVSTMIDCPFELDDSVNTITGWLRTEARVSYNQETGACTEVSSLASWDSVTGEFNDFYVVDAAQRFWVKTHAYVMP